jgi:formylglycine-generating enzyme required for sulfatase activity
VTERLVETMQSVEVPARSRRRAGLILGRLGWRPDDLDAFVEIPPGPFLYGEERERREIPCRYWVGKYPVTNAQYGRFVEDGGYERRELWSEDGWAWRRGDYDSQAAEKWERDWLAQRPPEKRGRPFWWDDLKWNNPIFPVVGVSWFEAGAYCRWLAAGGQVGEVQQVVRPSTRGSAGGSRQAALSSERYVVRLPAEEEWERAARGTDGRAYPWGDSFDFSRLSCAEAWAGKELDGAGWMEWFGQRPEFAATTAVCTYPQGIGPEGLWDAAGNVWEWTVSRWGSGARRRVVRGGSWIDDQRLARCACRLRFNPVHWSDLLGFRVVVSLALPSSDF